MQPSSPASSDENSAEDELNRTIVQTGASSQSQMSDVGSSSLSVINQPGQPGQQQHSAQPTPAETANDGTRPPIDLSHLTSSMQREEPRPLEVPPPIDPMRDRDPNRTIGLLHPSTTMPPQRCQQSTIVRTANEQCQPESQQPLGHVSGLLPRSSRLLAECRQQGGATLRHANQSSTAFGQHRHASSANDAEPSAALSLQEELRLANTLSPPEQQSTPPQQSAPPQHRGSPTTAGGHLFTVTDQIASILELQRRIQSLQRETDHYREVNNILKMSNDVYERERRMFQSVIDSGTGPRQAGASIANAAEQQRPTTSQMPVAQPRTSMATAADRPSTRFEVEQASYGRSVPPIVPRRPPMETMQHAVGTQHDATQHRPDATYAAAPANASVSALPYHTSAVDLQPRAPNPFASVPTNAMRYVPQYAPVETAPAQTLASYYVDTYNSAAEASSSSTRTMAGSTTDSNAGSQQSSWRDPSAVQREPTAVHQSQPRTRETRVTPSRRSIIDLPQFSGRAEDWPYFICSYETTTAEYGYSDLENMSRLQKALVGEAKVRARGILIRPEHVGRTIQALARAFGRPEALAESQLNEIHKLPKIIDNRPEQLISFSITVDSMVSLLDGPATEHLLWNSILLSALTSKLPTTDQRNWAAVARHIQPTPSIRDFARWLAEVADDVASMRSYTLFDSVQARPRDPKPPPNRGRHVLLNVSNGVSERRTECSFCGELHHIEQCDAFLKLSVVERLAEARKRPLCYYCLSANHLLPGCDGRKVCGMDKCARLHHKLLHEAVGRSDTQRPKNSQSNATARSQQQQSDEPAQRAKEVNPAPVKKPQQSQRSEGSSGQLQRSGGSSGQQKRSDNRSGQQQQSNVGIGSVCHLGHDDGSKKPRLYYRIVPVVLFALNRYHRTFALLDEGSSISLVDQRLADDLQLDGEEQMLCLQFVDGTSTTQLSRGVTLGISGIDNDAVRFDIETVQTADMDKLPIQTVNKNELIEDHPHLTDVPFVSYDNARPRILLGLEHHFLGVPLESRMSANLRGLTAARTLLGWTLYGCIGRPGCLPGAVVLHARRIDVNEEPDPADYLHELVRFHFTTEDFGVRASNKPIMSDDDERALSILESTTKRRGDRFETGLLWKREDVVLPESYQMAVKRLQSVEEKMRRNADYARQYRQQIEAYVQKGYARKMTPEEAAERGPRTWYLPHFAVFNANKPGKFRLVFDAAAISHKVSLNDMLLSGPDLNVPLTRLLFRFRLGAIGVCGDVREMFHQVWVRKEDQNAQRFLWRDNVDDAAPSVYVMVAMTFGSTCSPAAAQFVKNKNAEEFADQFPQAAAAIQRNHYVDDYVASFRTPEEALKITQDVVKVHARGGFELRGIISNCPTVREQLGAETALPSSVCLEPTDMTQKILGMEWETSDDVFVFKTRFNRVKPCVLEGSRPPTMRELLSFSMSIYDPFGLLADFLLTSKVLMQELWRIGMKWDDAVPTEIDKRWQSWRALVEQTRRVRIPRCYSPSIMDAPGLQLHVFADASEEAFAAAAYWRIEGDKGVELAFVCGKVRCAPLKLLSIPRLELQAAVLASRLMLEIRESHEELSISKIVFWSDSETVLKWLRCDQRRYVPFVAHRVAEVVESAPAHWWRWVPTALNVADDATRVKTPLTFDPDSRWLHGPAWLKDDPTDWPVQKLKLNDAQTTTEELRPKYVGFIVQRGAVEFARFSQFPRLVRCVAWARRFITNARGKRVAGELSAAEMEKATADVCRSVQAEAYAKEVSILKAGGTIGERSKLFVLKPYLDGDGVLRLHGRTDAAKEEFVPASMKRPVIMPREHYVTMLIIRHHHALNAHQLTDATIAAVRQKYWVPQIRTLVKSVRQACQLCRFRSTKPKIPSQGQLPADRMEAYARPFTHTGLDFFGPYFVTIGRRREKRWVALFTCMVIRAVHLEVAADLSTDSCLLCIRNLCHLRGVPSRIRCDNGTNFVGARSEIQRHPDFFDADAIQRELAVSGVEWTFNCPANPEAGGAWERLVQTVKRVLDVVLHERAPRVETFRSVLLEAANVVNARPLTHLQVDPEDPEPLTPNHFLLGGPNMATAPDPRDVEPVATRRQWKICQGLSRQFWSQFIRDYMPELTRRNKHYAAEPELAVGDLVVICDELQPRGRWVRGVVKEVAVGADGVVRTATVRTSSGEYRRPATRLAKLDVSSPDGIDERGAVSRTGAGAD